MRYIHSICVKIVTLYDALDSCSRTHKVPCFTGSQSLWQKLCFVVVLCHRLFNLANSVETSDYTHTKPYVSEGNLSLSSFISEVLSKEQLYACQGVFN